MEGDNIFHFASGECEICLLIDGPCSEWGMLTNGIRSFKTRASLCTSMVCGLFCLYNVMLSLMCTNLVFSLLCGFSIAV